MSKHQPPSNAHNERYKRLQENILKLERDIATLTEFKEAITRNGEVFDQDDQRLVNLSLQDKAEKLAKLRAHIVVLDTHIKDMDRILVERTKVVSSFAERLADIDSHLMEAFVKRQVFLHKEQEARLKEFEDEMNLTLGKVAEN